MPLSEKKLIQQIRRLARGGEALPDSRPERYRGHWWRAFGGVLIAGRRERRSPEVGGSLLEGTAGHGGRIQGSARGWGHGTVGGRGRNSSGHRGGGVGAERTGGAAVGSEGGRSDLCDRGVGRVSGGAGAADGIEAGGSGVFPALSSAGAGCGGPVAEAAGNCIGHDRLERRAFHRPRTHLPGEPRGRGDRSRGDSAGAGWAGEKAGWARVGPARRRRL